MASGDMTVVQYCDNENTNKGDNFTSGTFIISWKLHRIHWKESTGTSEPCGSEKTDTNTKCLLEFFISMETPQSGRRVMILPSIALRIPTLHSKYNLRTSQWLKCPLARNRDRLTSFLYKQFTPVSALYTSQYIFIISNVFIKTVTNTPPPFFSRRQRDYGKSLLCMFSQSLTWDNLLLSHA